MIEVCSLSSGSNGNAFFVKTGADAFLVDAGISCKQICLRLEQIGVSPNDLKAIFITHEHSDHVRGLRVFLKRFQVPVYITEKTYDRIEASIAEPGLNFIKADDTIKLNDTLIRSLPKCHDAVDPTLFCFHYKGKKISIVTDAGCACENVIESVKDADILFLESNYDEDMLRWGIYPPYLKRRIAGDYGHLSNNHAGSLILDHASSKLKHVFLSHLSENNNTPETALHTFLSIIKERDDLRHLETVVTSRYKVSPKIRFDLT
ncbi:MAG: MBL fold metallo-hydrolase [Candidatus Aminicenantes bacterium]|nr:MBL fold metallo-hydrolase [Candidatus Aminicenantes bacterium]